MSATNCTTTQLDESQISESIVEQNNQIDRLMNDLTEVKYRMEKAHFDLLLAVEPKLTSSIEKKYLNSLNCKC